MEPIRLPSYPLKLLQELEVDDGDAFGPVDKLDEGLLLELVAFSYMFELECGSAVLDWVSHFLLAAAMATAAAAVMNCIMNADLSFCRLLHDIFAEIFSLEYPEFGIKGGGDFLICLWG